MKHRCYPFLFVLSLLMTSLNAYSQNESKAENIPGYIDHILVTVSGSHFDSLVEVLKTTIPKSIQFPPDNSKVFILPDTLFPYVEIWNSSSSLYIGSQIALGSKNENAIAKTKEYYGHEGFLFGGELFTVGSEFSSGHPYGGNFFVDYGRMAAYMKNPNDSLEVSKLKEIQTVAPKTKASIKDDYTFFNLKIDEQGDVFIASDSNGSMIKTKLVESTTEKLFGGIGHVSLSFELARAIYQEKKEFKVGDNIKLIFDKKTFILILQIPEYDKF